MRIAINGFGRIGRLILRSLCEMRDRYPELQVVVINDLASPDTMAHLFRYDSIHGPAPFPVELNDSGLKIGEKSRIPMIQVSDPAAWDWQKYDVDMVFECTGAFTSREGAQKHLQAGARRVLISAPAGDPDLTVVYGVNHTDLQAAHTIISNASCTTNCLAPIAKILAQAVGIARGYMTTIHAVTGDQQLVDAPHKDLRRARAAMQSMIPTSTGAARAVGLVLPELAGKLDGCAMRVPTQNVSCVDFTFVPSQQGLTPQHVNDALREGASRIPGDVVSVTELPLVSADFNHCRASAVVDLNQTRVVDGGLVRVMAWYDNEWGFANRMLDVAALFVDAA